ncbi:hypothetical protein [Marinobacter salinexigens]|nr:hypothetical protein [Marinobacter salinexigens]
MSNADNEGPEEPSLIPPERRKKVISAVILLALGLVALSYVSDL